MSAPHHVADGDRLAHSWFAWRVRTSEVIDVLAALDVAGVRYWVAGGWGVAALTGRQTRDHRDLDLAVDARDLPACLEALEQLRYRVETHCMPVRVELRAPGERWVNVHPVTFDLAGHGSQPDLDGGHFDYPPTAFADGSIGSRPVHCLSVEQQRHFRTGYEHRPQDVHDLADLDALERGYDQLTRLKPTSDTKALASRKNPSPLRRRGRRLLISEASVLTVANLRTVRPNWGHHV